MLFLSVPKQCLGVWLCERSAVALEQAMPILNRRVRFQTGTKRWGQGGSVLS